MKQRLPLSVISGYLGAGKTTLINRLLSEPHGQKLLIMVNDFGAINIDASLLESATNDTLTLTNGCVCCTMGADLYMAIGDVLDQPARPDHLIIEASGISDPARIAQVAETEPELSYGGIMTLVDALEYPQLAQDAQIGPQVRDQVRVADAVLISKTAQPDAALSLQLGALTRGQILNLADLPQVAPIVLGGRAAQAPRVRAHLHPAYEGWSFQGPGHIGRKDLETALATRPGGLFRVKGFVAHTPHSGWEVHAVGRSVSIKPHKRPTLTELVGIGLRGAFDPAEADKWWQDAKHCG